LIMVFRSLIVDDAGAERYQLSDEKRCDEKRFAYK
jgi:hypothetical protein